MKKNLLLLAAFIVLVVGSFENLKAQDQTVNVASGFDYWVTLNGTNTYNFEVLLMPANTVLTPGPGTYTISNGTNVARKHIVWNSANATGEYYRIRITESSAAPASCPGTPVIYDVLVNATGSIQFASSGPATPTCSISDTKTINLSASSTVTFPINLVVTTVINGVTTTGVALNNIATASINVTDLGLNTSTADRNNTITITGATTAGGGTLTIGATATYTFPVYGTPSTSTIQHN